MVNIVMPAVDLYSQLSGLGDTLQNNAKLAQQKAFSADIASAHRPDGSIDWNAVSDSAARHNVDLPTTLSILKLGQDQRKQDQELQASKDFRSGLGNIFGGGAAPSASPATPAVATPATPAQQPGAPIQPTSKVWGDDEGVKAGIYDPAPAPATTSYGGALGRKPKPLPIGLQPQPAGGAPDVAPTPAAPATPVLPPQPAQQPSAASGFEGLGAQHIPQLVNALADPRLPAGDRDLAKTLLTKALDNSKPNEKLEYLKQLKESSGFQGTPLDLEMQLRRAGKTDINIDQKAETAEAQSAGKAAGDRRAKMFDAADGATKNLANLTRVQTLLDQVEQGKLQPNRMTISAWAKSLGVNDDFAKGLGLDPSKVGDAQALQALTNELVLGKIGAGGLPANNFSDADRTFLTDTLPKLGNDPRANKILIESARRVNQDNIQRALDFQSWQEDPANKGKGFENFELSRARKVQQMDRFGDLRKQAETLLPASGGASGNAAGIPWRVQ